MIIPPDNSSHTIRRMRFEDLDEVMVIEELSFSTPWSRRAYTHEIEDNHLAHLWVTEVCDFEGHQRVVGMLVMWLILDEAHIANLAVHPEYRRRGYAERMICMAFIEAIGRGAKSITLEVREGNRAAQLLYHSFGLKAVGRRPKYYKDSSEDALIMTLIQLNRDMVHDFQTRLGSKKIGLSVDRIVEAKSGEEV